MIWLGLGLGFGFGLGNRYFPMGRGNRKDICM